MLTPAGLPDIYEVLENERGVIVTYNYDRITDHQSRFRVITPHGQRSGLLADARTYNTSKRLALELDIPIHTDWWLPIPETELVCERTSYQDAWVAWRKAHAIAFIGYGFGSGADMFSLLLCEDCPLSPGGSARFPSAQRSR
jgi:hypothetical protein